MRRLTGLLRSILHRDVHSKSSLILFICIALVVPVPVTPAQTFSVLHTFGVTDGSGPSAGITLEPHLNRLWGVTWYGGLLTCDLGGAVGCGVIFELTKKDSRWSFSVPYIFPGNDNGFLPTFPSQIVIGPNGFPYGAELEGGTSLEGTVYSLDPSKNISVSNAPWRHTILHTFGDGSDGSYPHKIIFDQAGNIFGATGLGGSVGYGTIYELSPSNQGWTENILYNFAGAADGQIPREVVSDGAGNLYGVTEQGGNAGCSPFQGCGTIFELTPSGSSWTKTTLHAFQQDTEGGFPGPLMRDSKGNLFGLTSQNGPNNFGTIWELSPSSGGWIFTVLYSFTQQIVGLFGPFAPVMDASGALYGLNNLGGVNFCNMLGETCGNIYKLAPSNNGWIYSDVHDFALDNNGCLPSGPASIDSAGNLYGVAYGCGANGVGVVFQFTPQDSNKKILPGIPR